MDNHTDYPDWDAPGWSSWLPLGESALVWATTEHSSYEPHNNHDKWGTARTLFYKSLKDSDKTVREQYLAESLLKLGCVLHLIEDMGVPAHTRNDFLYGHYRSVYTLDWGNPLEGWVEDRIIANNNQSPWSGTGPVVFDKLSKYFDTDVYDGNYLGNGILPPEDLWGLAECTNYQFLSLSTVFGCSGVKYQFPHPVKERIATPALVEYIIDGNDIRMKLYFNGSNYCVPHLARYSYTYYKKTIWGGEEAVVDSTNTTDDVNVFEDYAYITIPRTIDYATGLINYFFRGRLNVEPNWTDPNIVELVITNDSNNSGIGQTIKGGTFELYWDDVNDTRTQIDSAYITFTPEWTSAGTLPNDAGLTELNAQFAPPAEVVKKYIVVYRGNICQDPADPDLDDPEAIAIHVIPKFVAVAGSWWAQKSVWILDAGGNLLWTYNTGATTRGIEVSASGDVYVVGERSGGKNIWKLNSSGELIWDYDTGSDTLYDVAITKLNNITYVHVTGTDSGGDCIWKLRDLGDSVELVWKRSWVEGVNEGFGIAANDNSGNVYIAGEWAPDPELVKNVLAYDSSGGFRYHQDAGSRVYCIAVDDSDDYFYFGKSAWLGENCVYKYTTECVFVWEWGNNVATNVKGIAVDRSGNVFVVGERILDRSVWKLNSSHTLVWDYDTTTDAEGVALDSLGGIYIAGTLGNYSVYKLNSAGQFVWGWDGGGPSVAYAVATNI